MSLCVALFTQLCTALFALYHSLECAHSVLVPLPQLLSESSRAGQAVQQPPQLQGHDAAASPPVTPPRPPLSQEQPQPQPQLTPEQTRGSQEPLQIPGVPDIPPCATAAGFQRMVLGPAQQQAALKEINERRNAPYESCNKKTKPHKCLLRCPLILCQKRDPKSGLVGPCT